MPPRLRCHVHLLGRHFPKLRHKWNSRSWRETPTRYYSTLFVVHPFPSSAQCAMTVHAAVGVWHFHISSRSAARLSGQLHQSQPVSVRKIKGYSFIEEGLEAFVCRSVCRSILLITFFFLLIYRDFPYHCYYTLVACSWSCCAGNQPPRWRGADGFFEQEPD